MPYYAKSNVRQSFYECELHKRDSSQGSYGGSPIAIQGFFKAMLQYKDHVDTDKGAPIFGCSGQCKMYIILDPTCNDPILQTNIADQYTEVFKHDNTKVATHVLHKILWKPDVQYKVRNIPLAV